MSRDTINSRDARREFAQVGKRLSQQPWNKDRGGDLRQTPPLGWETPDGRRVI